MIFNDANASMAIPHVEEGILSDKRFCFRDAASTATSTKYSMVQEYGAVNRCQWLTMRGPVALSTRGNFKNTPGVLSFSAPDFFF